MLKQIPRMLARCVKQFFSGHYYVYAAALAFTSALGIVPLLSVLATFLSKFSLPDALIDQLQEQVIHNFLPSNADVVASYVNQFTHQAAHMTLMQFAFILVVALLLMNTVVGAVNHIWHVKQARKPGKKLTIFIVLLVVAPFFLVVSITLSSYLFSVKIFEGLAWLPILKRNILIVLPYFCSLFAFVMLYYFVPNCRVKFKHAVAGGLVSMFLFEVSKKIFSLYLLYFPTYHVLYGALGVIPIVLLWLYLFWLVVMTGGLIAHQLDVDESSL